jgi:hypothetical protein
VGFQVTIHDTTSHRGTIPGRDLGLKGPEDSGLPPFNSFPDFRETGDMGLAPQDPGHGTGTSSSPLTHEGVELLTDAARTNEPGTGRLNRSSSKDLFFPCSFSILPFANSTNTMVSFVVHLFPHEPSEKAGAV